MTKKLTVFQFHFKTIIDTLNSGRYMDSLDDATYIDQLLESLNFDCQNLSPRYFFLCTSGRKPTQIRRIYVPLENVHLHP